MFSAPAAVTEKASERCQVGDRKANTSELRSNVESTQTTSKPAGDVAMPRQGTEPFVVALRSL
jgi:hypothetical protein